MRRIAMSRRRQLVAGVGIVLCWLASGCAKPNPFFCEDQPEGHCQPDAMIGPPCTTNSQCSGDKPVCGPDEACVACTAHDECDSKACLPSGACGDDTSVAYVDPGGTDNTSCTQAMKCTGLDKALATNRPFVKLSGTVDSDKGTITRSVTFLAEPGAELTRSTGTGAILTVSGDGVVFAANDLTIRDSKGIGVLIPPGMGAPSVSLSNVTLSKSAGVGISNANGALTLTRSRIVDNEGGGVSITDGKFTIVGNFFDNNGKDNGSVGGVFINTAQDLTNQLELNSFSRNRAQTGTGTAIDCKAGVFTARNNILSGRGALNTVPIGGTCTHTFSIIEPGTIPVGDGNKFEDPLFKDAASGDLHLLANSPARGKGDPATSLTGVATYDIDGDLRKSPPDIGADQAK